MEMVNLTTLVFLLQTSNESSPRDGQPKVVSVRLEPHHGQRSNVPYIVRPNQSIVPGNCWLSWERG